MKKMIYTLICAGSLFCLSKGESQTRSLDENYSHSLEDREEAAYQASSLPPSKGVKDQTLISQPYFNFGVNHYVLPSVGIGYRIQKNIHAFDTYASFSALKGIQVVDLSASYLLGNKVYGGLGPAVSYMNTSSGFYSSRGTFAYGAKGIAGMRFSEKTFAQLEANQMFIEKEYVPTLSFRFGRSF